MVKLVLVALFLDAAYHYDLFNCCNSHSFLIKCFVINDCLIRICNMEHRIMKFFKINHSKISFCNIDHLAIKIEKYFNGLDLKYHECYAMISKSSRFLFFNLIMVINIWMYHVINIRGRQHIKSIKII
jgi:hypothetical protein